MKGIVLAGGSGTRMVQVVANLLNNACKYTRPGGHVAHAQHEGAAVEIHLERDVLPRIFEPFVQGPRPEEHARGGLGVGLTLVQRLVALHVLARLLQPFRQRAFYNAFAHLRHHDISHS